MRFPQHYREYAVGHSYEGFTLNSTDRWLPGWFAETVLGVVLGTLGHPCCGRGVGRIEVINAAAYRLLNGVTNWGITRDRRRVDVPITVDQAITLAPWYRDWIGPDGSITVDGEDESGDIWADAKLVAARCDDCGRLLDARGRWSAKVIQEHRPECNAAQ
ncbi:MAG: hypothetical protein L0H84_16485 [Pseudonocardia sp.]|nr:hypothetical protein [Pseudonocardia sp.]